MNKKTVKSAILLVSAICISSMVSCGKSVQRIEESSESNGFSISESSWSKSVDSTSATGENSEFIHHGVSSGITLSYYEAEVIAGQTIEYPVVSETITEVWASSDENIATVDSIGNITGVSEGNCMIKVFSESDSNMYAEIEVTVKKPEGVQQIDGLTYVNGILIANKTYSLPEDYNPEGLTDETYTAFQELSAGALNDGLDIYISSGFRSYEYQNEIYNNYVDEYGQETADTFSARPGHSEHQTGMAIDVNIIDDSFTGTPEAIWIEEHCTEYGFILRYPQGKQDITGYKYEPWHIRYVGKEVAQAVKDAGNAVGDPYLTLEEYLNIDSYYH
ncbi:MAG: D-alanyl-D-alanine carboxypeptidase family protein [Ruminococcus sp.]|nr:D-alanyl-D-alanine carboxypeptidase family protein [Ruminococcus sp.]